MKLNIDPDWLLRMAEKENGKIISVGGLVTRVKASMRVETKPSMDPAGWSQVFPLKAMRNLHFSLPEGKSDSEVLLRFFGVQSPDAWQTRWNKYSVAFRQTKRFDFCGEELVVAAWVREAEIIADKIPLKKFNEAKLRATRSVMPA
ncbi:MAG: hypothetical protein AAFR31_16725, partial [Cyanobacteria bacterium J06627_8]